MFNAFSTIVSASLILMYKTLNSQNSNILYALLSRQTGEIDQLFNKIVIDNIMVIFFPLLKGTKNLFSFL